ncbi:CHLOROPHYLL A/B BINDING PROTEIN [Salix viminalis]|uniref:Chlorophyll a-b binding protein, chloroplastic n=1 Tax=Salix viminalis TaxID=40686 RepID=A0A9Q0NRA4_SALVM|nr:CHLOROPHYLL A/B BINDING PROTEIN [Salix viminalis]
MFEDPEASTWQRSFYTTYTAMTISIIQEQDEPIRHLFPRGKALSLLEQLLLPLSSKEQTGSSGSLRNKVCLTWMAAFQVTSDSIPLGLSDPEGTGGFIEPKWLAYGEIINGRPPIPWFKTGVIPPAGTYSYWADPYTLFVFEMALMGFAEHRRLQDWANPGSMGKQYFLGFEKYLGGSGEPAYPGGPLFNPLGFGKDEKSLKELKLKEVKNGRLAMLAILGYFVQALNFIRAHSYQSGDRNSPPSSLRTTPFPVISYSLYELGYTHSSDSSCDEARDRTNSQN